MSIIEDNDILKGFINESKELLDGIENDLLVIEDQGEHAENEVVNKIFRAIHTIKGGAGFVGLETIKELAHETENILNLIRNKSLTPNHEIINILLKAIDVIKGMINNHESSNTVDISEELVLLKGAASCSVSDKSDKQSKTITSKIKKGAKNKIREVIPLQSISPEKTVPLMAQEVISNSLSVTKKDNEPRSQEPVASPQEMKEKFESNLRVNVTILDKLMNLAGELVLTRNQLVQTVASKNIKSIETATQRVDLITSEMQEAVMATRMQPIKTVFNKFKRIVRDLTRELGKEVDLIIEGEEVNLDKTIIEALADPLTHLVRNALDHGIESPEMRKKSGKKPKGILFLKAFHEAGQVIIEIKDDGKGIDHTAIKNKALSLGSFNKAQLDNMTRKDLINLIFLPGFSLAERVTEFSGRGVGMDVVYNNLTKLGGIIDINTNVGEGTTLRIKLPLTLAIIPSLLISVQNERFAIPQVNLVELVRVPASQVKKKISKIGSSLVMRLREDILPLIQLSEVIGISSDTFIDPQTDTVFINKREDIIDRRGGFIKEGLSADESNRGNLEDNNNLKDRRSGKDRRYHAQSSLNIAVVTAGDFNYGIVLDALLDSEEIVVKPLGYHLKGCKAYAGATILGDGRVALILDVVNICKMKKLLEVKEIAQGKVAQKEIEKHQDAQSLLIVENGPGERFAVPLGLVSRIERIHKSSIQIMGGRRAIKYRGVSLPLFSIEEVAKVTPHQETKELYVIVFSIAGREVGILVSQIIDIIDVAVSIDDITHRQPGIIGSAIILDEITLLIDLFGIISAVMPEWLIKQEPKGTRSKEKVTILVIDDSAFFRNQIKGFVEEIGYNVIIAEDGLQAIQELNKHEREIDLIMTDIEMPNLNGLEFSKKVRGDSRFDKVPIIAITSVAGESAEQRGLEAGINEYLVKLDREKIQEKIQHYLDSAKK
ncbi:MAG: chemotaxis protein CheW [bacterium]